MSRYPDGIEKAWYVTLSPENRELLGHMKRHGLSVQFQVKDGETQPLGEHLVVELMNGNHLVSTHVGHDVEQLFETAYESALPVLEKIDAALEG